MFKLYHRITTTRLINHTHSLRYYHITRPLYAIKPFILADIGEGIAEVELMQWFVKEGDKVKSFDRLCEVQSDKATVEITSRFDGIISSIHHTEGDIVKVGDALVDIETSDIAEVTPSTPAPSPTPAPSMLRTSVPPVDSTHPPTSTGTSKPFILADIGEGIAEVELMSWYVKVGDKVKSFDRICEVQSDKATVEITSRYDGIVTAVHHAEGSIVKVGEALVDIQEVGSATPKMATEVDPVVLSVPPSSSTSPPATTTCPYAASSDRKVLTTPAVRKIAKDNAIDLSLVPGTGPKGRILKEDILRFIKEGGAVSTMPTAPVSTPSPVSESTKASTPLDTSSRAPATSPSGQDKTVPIRGVQRLMVKSMTEALKVPHLTYCEEVVMDSLISVRKQLKEAIEKRGSKTVRMSFMPIIIKATSLALLEYPQLNASINSEATEVTYHADHNMGIAMDTPKGLIVPVLKQVQNKSPMQIAIELSEMQDLATRGALTEEHLRGGTFSLSNIGSVGGTYMRPVIVVPQVVIGAFGRFQTTPRYVDSMGRQASTEDIYDGKATVKPTTIMNVSWSADHRVVDGASVARFSNLWKTYLENPSLMLGELR